MHLFPCDEYSTLSTLAFCECVCYPHVSATSACLDWFCVLSKKRQTFSVDHVPMQQNFLYSLHSSCLSSATDFFLMMFLCLGNTSFLLPLLFFSVQVFSLSLKQTLLSWPLSSRVTFTTIANSQVFCTNLSNIHLFRYSRNNLKAETT